MPPDLSGKAPMGWATLRKPDLLVAGPQDSLPGALQHVQEEVADMLRDKIKKAIGGELYAKQWTLSQGQKQFLVTWVVYCVENHMNCSRSLAAGALHTLRESNGTVANIRPETTQKVLRVLEADAGIAGDATKLSQYVKTSEAELEKAAAEHLPDAVKEPEGPGQAVEVKQSVIERISHALKMLDFAHAVEVADEAMRSHPTDLPTRIAIAGAYQTRGLSCPENHARMRRGDVIMAIRVFESILAEIDPARMAKSHQSITKALERLRVARQTLEKEVVSGKK